MNMSMTTCEAIQILENEILCVSSDCNRDCGKCNLALENVEDIVTALRIGIECIKIAVAEIKKDQQ